jgi:hypothetical protein
MKPTGRVFFGGVGRERERERERETDTERETKPVISAVVIQKSPWTSVTCSEVI